MYQKEYVLEAVGRVSDFPTVKEFNVIDLFDYDEWLIIKDKRMLINEFDNLINLCSKSLGIAKVNNEEEIIKTKYINMDNSIPTLILRKAIKNIKNIVIEEFKNQYKSLYREGGEISFNFRHLFKYSEWIEFEKKDLINAEKEFKKIISETDILKIKSSDDLFDYKLILKE